MRKSAIATLLILTVSIVGFIADMTQQGYMVFTSVSDIKKTLPDFTPPQFVKVLEGNDKGCLTKPSQTKPVTLLTSPRFIILIARVTYIDITQLYNRLLDSFHKMLRNGSIHIDPNPRD